MMSVIYKGGSTNEKGNEEAGGPVAVRGAGVGLVPAMAASPVCFPEFQENVGVGMKADKPWPDYGEYHVIVRAERDASRPNGARRNCVTVRWDSALRPEGSTFTATPEKGDDRPSNTD